MSGIVRFRKSDKSGGVGLPSSVICGATCLFRKARENVIAIGAPLFARTEGLPSYARHYETLEIKYGANPREMASDKSVDTTSLVPSRDARQTP
jgi:hypothetical protein